MSEKQKRRRWTASEKLRVVLAGLDGSVEVSELCRREGINPTQYYGGRSSCWVLRRRCSRTAGSRSRRRTSSDLKPRMRG
ncbi:MAG: transposase [Pirellulales bacterium]|nr:transposase [Pirellulales bacterium]